MEDKDYINSKNYYKQEMECNNLSVDVLTSSLWETGHSFKEHWHEQLQIFYFKRGKALARCNKKSFYVSEKDIIIVNSRDLHYVESLSDDLSFRIIRIDLPFLFSDQIDLCQTKYLSPLSENAILFKNLIHNDDKIISYVESIIKEYSDKKIGYELAIKGYIYNILTILLRNYIEKYMTKKQLKFRINNFNRFSKVFKFIDDNYTKKISAEDLAHISHISTYYFCRTFKQMTGKTVTQYINEIRLKKAAQLLKNHNMTITEISIECGFNDINYFSRLFKKVYGKSPKNFET